MTPTSNLRIAVSLALRKQHLAGLPVPAPSPAQLERLVPEIAERLGRSLERAGLVTRDLEKAWLAFAASEEPPMHALIGHSTPRATTGPREGQQVFTLQTLPADPERSRTDLAAPASRSMAGCA